MSLREALAICARPEHLRSTISIALVVGTVLALINHLDAIVSGDVTTATWIQIGVTYLVPFTVANLGLIAGKRTDPRDPGEG